MGLSIATTRVSLAAVGPGRALTFKAAGQEARRTIQFDDLNPADRALLARLVARLRPYNADALARAGIYLEVAGDTATADAYYQRAGTQWRDLLPSLFE